MASYDRLDVFFTYILPQGFMELTAIFIAAAALALPWLILLAPALILGVWLSGRGPSGFYED